ncbi:response regulator [Nitrincola alkalilacustris]|uniref:response regulator n=1 Tax=Nitrincola alkalilacustris TaxID=1571224 RepID=UPI00124E0857|nr:response regulator [Nitrincola alkalilacustris]
MQLQKLMYVEDDEDIQVIARLALQTVGGLGVEICSSGEEALARIDEIAPQMILLDVMMPGMDGPETLRHLRDLPEFADTPIAFMTAKVQPQEVQSFMKLGACAVIAKPFDPMTLAQEVRKIWDTLHE